MIFTTITKDNVDYFGEKLAEYWKSNASNRTYLGLADDKGEAVGAAVLDMVGDNADIRYFAIADAHRGKGYGRYFLDCILKSLDRRFVSGLSFVCYVDEEEKPPYVFDFLTHCGFEAQKGKVKRTVYEMKDIIAAAPFGKSTLPKGTSLIRGAMADDIIRKKVLGLSKDASNANSYFDGKLVLSNENRYGGIMITNDEIDCMLSIVPFEKGARLEGMYAKGSSLNELMYLFDYAIEAITVEEPVPSVLYVDTAEGKLLQFEDTLMKKKKINRTARMESWILTRRG